jgi:hypothetical protein
MDSFLNLESVYHVKKFSKGYYADDSQRIMRYEKIFKGHFQIGPLAYENGHEKEYLAYQADFFFFVAEAVAHPIIVEIGTPSRYFLFDIPRYHHRELVVPMIHELAWENIDIPVFKYLTKKKANAAIRSWKKHELAVIRDSEVYLSIEELPSY